MNMPFKFKLSILGLALVASEQACATDVTNFSDWLSNGDVSGDLRVYNFSRDFAGTNSNTKSAAGPIFPDNNAFSVGGKVKLETASWDGVSAAAALYSAYDVGLNNYTRVPGFPAAYNEPYLYSALMGNNPTLDTLGEAYLQYQKSGFMLRGGNELINNPWVNSSDGFMIPNLFQGVSTVIALGSTGAQLSIDKIFQFKNRTNDAFDQSSLAILPYDKLLYPGQSGGATDAGLTYKDTSTSLAAWLYQWNNLAQMTYLEGGYTPSFAGRTWFVNGQYVNEIGLGSQDVGPINAQVYGLKLGMNLDQHLGNVFVAYNLLPSTGPIHVSGGLPNPVYNGNLFSPYTQIYNTDPLYTTVMNYGLVSARAPGSAWMLGATLHPVAQMDLLPTVSEYYTEAGVAPVRAYMIDAAWHFSGSFKGLSIRDRLGVEHDVPFIGSSFVENRFMLQYNF